jgi:hypothetical protein
MRNNKIILLILLLPSCMQPSVVVKPSNEIKSSVKQSVAPITPKVIESVNPVLSEIKESPIANIVVSSKPSVIESDGNLTSKITDVITTPTPSPTSTIYTKTPIIQSPSVYDLPIKPEERTEGRTITECDNVYGGKMSPEQCKIYLEEKNYKPTYSQVLPIPTDRDYGEIVIIFKDEYKIRYDVSSNKFISLIGADTTSLNELILSVNPKIYQAGNIFSESEAEETERTLEQECKCDEPNSKSGASIMVTKTNLFDYITKLRNNTFVRQANDYGLPTLL